MNSLGILPPKPHISAQNLNSTLKALTSFLIWRLRSQSSKGFSFKRRERFRIHKTTALLQHSEHDVVVVGAGIIGLSIARQLLLESDLSVAIVDASLPCSGATGAGQGYIWMAHKTPGSDTWELAMRSKHLWEELAESVRRRGLDPLQVLGWKKTGSSRQFSGFSKEVEEPIVKSILERATEFFPALNNLLLELNEKGKIRVGFRPYMPDGKPVIGPILILPKVFLATGHEGSGLSLALGTAEMVADMILGNPSRVDCKPFSVEGRFSY